MTRGTGAGDYAVGASQLAKVAPAGRAPVSQGRCVGVGSCAPGREKFQCWRSVSTVLDLGHLRQQEL